MIALLIELAVKSAVIAGVGLLLAAALGSRPAADRVDILRAAVVLLLILPLIMLAGPRLAVPLLTAPAVEPATASTWSATLGPVRGLVISGSVRPWSLTIGLLAAAWVLGAALVAGRFAVGLWVLHRWTAAGRPVTDNA
jgi:hypothetical protein